MKFSVNLTSKYHNHREGGFDSKRERERFAELRLLERAGAISELKRQVRFELIPAQYRDGRCVFRSVSYVADFTYKKNGELIVEDSKGFKTPEYKIKRKLMLWVLGILVIES